MKKVSIVILLLILTKAAQAQNQDQDLESGGSNSWVFHTPDDGRTTMHIAPKINNNWEWGRQTIFSNNGDVSFSGNLKTINPLGYPYGVNIDNNFPGEWAREFSFTRNGGAKLFALGAYGSDNTLNYGYIGGSSTDGIVYQAPWLTFHRNGSVGIGTMNTMGDFLHVKTGGQYFRVGTWGVGISDAAFRHTFLMANNSNYSELYNNEGKPLILQHTNKGRVGIGTISPGYELDVIGTVRAREIKVDLSGADFVFEQNYKLMPLDELEKYIKANKHLPEISAAKEMQEQGANLGDLNCKLLQKIEELTLYTLAQNKKIEQQNIQLKEQQAKMVELEQQKVQVKVLEEKLKKIEGLLSLK